MRGRKLQNPVPVSFPGNTNGRGFDEKPWEACRDILCRVYGAKAGSRRLSNIFQELPDRGEFPDYYKAIPEPECLDHIAAQLASQAYPNPETFFKQLHLVFLNAKHYNEESSTVHSDAIRLEQQIFQDWSAKAEAQVFSHKNPYHNGQVKPGRKRARGSSALPTKSATPGPLTEVQRLSPIVEPIPIPTPAKLPSASPIPSSIPTPTPASLKRPALFRPSPQSRPTASPSITLTLNQAYSTGQSTTLLDRTRMAPRDADQAIIAARDATLPKWEGPKEVLPGNPSPGGIPGSGWFGEGTADYERNIGGPEQWSHKIREVLGALEGYRDHSGQRLAEVLDILPEVVDIPYLSFNHPLSFARINAIADASRYPSLRDFDMDMVRLFEKARRWFHDGSEEYGRVLVLQRLYNALTSIYPLQLPPSGIPEPSSVAFASIPAGPGNARSMHEATQELRAGAAEEQVGYGITTFRVGTKDRVFTEEARHKGMAYRLGDYVHVMNPDDPTRPIIGQIFKTFVPTKGKQTHHASICWYYRPEQTVHTPDQMFYEHEVFKTGQFCDHPVEDIMERISVQFYVKYIRGRPREGEFYPGWPVYVCNSRFNHRDYNIVRIKNWNSCIPEELRQTDFMSIIPFERVIEARMVPSPLSQGVQGPGFFGEPKKILGGSAAQDDDDDDDEDKGRRRGRSSVHSAAHTPAPQNQPRAQPPAAVYRASPAVAPPPQPQAAPVVVPAPQLPITQPVLVQQPIRTFAALMGGQQALDQVAHREMLPAETARLFPTDARGQVLWFSGPPLAPGAIQIPQQPVHSVEYLQYLTKRKRGEEWTPKKTKRRSVAGLFGTQNAESTDEDISNLWWAEGKSCEEVFDSLKDIVEDRS
uniref:Chromatin structure-remodeling complex subunit RSC1/2 n=1 Tax=Cryptococcus bacillisporus CA1280 TaxID=1296109 RepID=A0A0D0UCC7_CRYGA|nr:chromatin structure-remodeling complex subunit RSC1/2 [Cryptococcus bacillisporus CA1280]